MAGLPLKPGDTGPMVTQMQNAIIGKGYSVVDGERIDWQAGDLLLLPIKPGGVEHQHFNINPGSECRWIAFSYMPFFDHVASEFTQTEVSPLFKAQQG